MLISKSSPDDFNALRSVLEKKLNIIDSLEGAAKIFVNEFYQQFKESIVLLRLFVTISFSDLQVDIQNFTHNLAKSANISLNDESTILTLLGTIGIKDEWLDRKKSKGHQGIPLASEEFDDSIPMMSALLEQVGFDLVWIRDGKEILTHVKGRPGGTFYVENASSSKDRKGRFIISMQDYVKEFDIKFEPAKITKAS